MLTLGGPVLARKDNDKPINLIYIDHRCYESLEWASQDSGQDSRGHRQRRERLAVLDARQSEREASQARPKPRAPRKLGTDAQPPSQARQPTPRGTTWPPCGLHTPTALLVIDDLVLNFRTEIDALTPCIIIENLYTIFRRCA